MDLKKWTDYKNIIIFGAGDISTRVIEWFIYKKIDHLITNIAVTNVAENPQSIYGIPVIGAEELTSQAETTLVLVATVEDKHEEIGTYLQKLGFKHIDYIRKEVYLNWNNENEYKHYIVPYLQVVRQYTKDYQLDQVKRERIMIREMKKIIDESMVSLPRLVVILGTKCSLRCKECNNLIPHFKPQEDIEIEDILDSLETILNKVDTLFVCELIGGEPFLSKNLEQAIYFLQEKENVYQIEITTNGMIVPDDALIPSLQKDKVKVRISNYGTIVNSQRMVEYLVRNKIRYQMLGMERWISPGDTEKRGRDKTQLEKCYKNCSSGIFCKTLFKDKVFACARAASLYTLDYMKEEEYLTIDDKLTREDIKEFWLQAYSEACNYCDMGCIDKKFVPVAEQI